MAARNAGTLKQLLVEETHFLPFRCPILKILYTCLLAYLAFDSCANFYPCQKRCITGKLCPHCKTLIWTAPNQSNTDTCHYFVSQNKISLSLLTSVYLPKCLLEEESLSEIRADRNIRQICLQS
jgi:hypothetical protein